jgi:hypothetical protein
VTYHYHALFREFLLEELGRRIATEERRAVTARAGHLVSARGLQSEALALFRDASEWEEMRKVILAQALEWARQAARRRFRTGSKRCRRMREHDPWLAYWFGRAWIFVEPHKGRPAIERAYEAFRAAGDGRGGGARAERDGEQLLLHAGRPSHHSIAGCPSSSVCFAKTGRQARSASELRARAALLITLLLASRTTRPARPARSASTSSSTAKAISTCG